MCGARRPDHAVRVARPPRTVDEQRVAALLAGLPSPGRCALVAALADELRLAESDPFRGVGEAELGIWRLSLYQTTADELVSTFLGDFLVEEPARS